MRKSSGACCGAIGIGFGPSNLALAVAHETLRSKEKSALPTLRFLEARPEFDWHPEMLLDDAHMQVCFLKDLITCVDPTSQFSFLNYMKQTDGLSEFINLRSFYPSRIEYRNYLRWAADKLESFVTYGAKVVAIRPLVTGGTVKSFDIEYLIDGRLESAPASNIILACGGAPRMPRGCDSSFLHSERVIHSGSFIRSLAKTFPDQTAALRFAVVGSGQSAAEMFQHLYCKYPNAQVTLITSRIGLKPADSSQFVNTLFDEAFVDDYFSAPEGFRLGFLSEHKNTNYGVVDEALISQLSRDMYADARFGPKRLRLQNFSILTGIHAANEVRLTVENSLSGSRAEEAYDGVFLGTGYTFDAGLKLLDGLRDFLVCRADGSPVINRDYSLSTRNMNAKVFLLGPTERTHGLSSTLLSLLPQRAQEVLRAILEEQVPASSRGIGSELSASC